MCNDTIMCNGQSSSVDFHRSPISPKLSSLRVLYTLLSFRRHLSVEKQTRKSPVRPLASSVQHCTMLIFTFSRVVFLRSRNWRTRIVTWPTRRSECRQSTAILWKWMWALQRNGDRSRLSTNVRLYLSLWNIRFRNTSLLADLGSIGTNETPFQLVNVSTVALRKVTMLDGFYSRRRHEIRSQIIEWTNQHIGDPPSEETDTRHPRRRVTLSEWDQAFLSVENPVLFALILVCQWSWPDKCMCWSSRCSSHWRLPTISMFHLYLMRLAWQWQTWSKVKHRKKFDRHSTFPMICHHWRFVTLASFVDVPCWNDHSSLISSKYNRVSNKLWLVCSETTNSCSIQCPR